MTTAPGLRPRARAFRPARVAAVTLAAVVGFGSVWPFAPGAAFAHEFWLEPSAIAATPGRPLAIAAVSGMGFRGELRPFSLGRVVRLAAFESRWVDLTGTAPDSGTVFANVSPGDDGGVLVAYESRPAFIELPAADFDRYLEEDGLDGARSLRRSPRAGNGPQRERYARCAKTWIGGGAPQRACQTAGLTLELTPERDPGAGDAPVFRLRFRGRPLPHALVQAWCRPAPSDGGPGDPAGRDSVGVAVVARTDARGRFRLTGAREGHWLVSCVHMLPSDDPADCDWRSWWASFSFVRHAPAP